MGTKAKWTFMIYMAGDNNLSTAGDYDLTEMRAVGSSDDVNIVSEFDNEGNNGTNRYLVKRGGTGEPTVSLGETDSGDPKILMDFVDWAAQKYPAERYALVLWNHGGGWEPSEMDRIARSVNSLDYNVREASERSATPLRKIFFRSSLATIFKRKSPKERAISSDDGSGHSLDTVELGKVLAHIHKTLGQPLDILGMDACLMSNLEVAYQSKEYVKYIVASEESEPNEGWPYDYVLKILVENPQLSTAKLAASIVHAYIKSYNDRNYGGAVTQAAIDLSRVQLLTDPLDHLADSLIKAMPKAANAVWNAQKRSAHFWHNTLWDISHFCQELENEAVGNDICKAAHDVWTSLMPGEDRFVLAESHNGLGVERCGGVSIYLLPPLEDISVYYRCLNFAEAHRWMEMLKSYHSS